METRTNKKPRSHETTTKVHRSQRSSDNSLSKGLKAYARPVTNDRTRSIPSVARPEGERQPIDSVVASEGSAPARLGNISAEKTDHSVPQPVILSNQAIECEGGNQERERLDQGIQEANLAVVGASGSGKSTFIRCALDLKTRTHELVSSKKVSLDGSVSLLRLLKINLNDVELAPGHKSHWPERVGDVPTSRIDGVLVLYDVTNESSIDQVPVLVDALTQKSIPCALVPSRCDRPQEEWELNPQEVEASCNALAGIKTFQTSITAPDTHKRCLSMILKRLALVQNGEALRSSIRHPPTRQRALTASRAMTTKSAKQKHLRAISDLHGFPPVPASPVLSHTKTSDVRTSTSQVRTIEGPSSKTLDDASKPALDSDPKAFCHKVISSKSEGNGSSRSLVTLEPDLAIRSMCSNTLDGAELGGSFDNAMENGNHGQNSDEQTATTSTENLPSATGSEAGVPFDYLIDRLLSQAMSKADCRFVAIFLCLYRKFAPPALLLKAIIERFELLSKTEGPYLTRITAQLRNLNVLSQWIGDFPGDFAHPTTRRQMGAFLTRLEKYRVFAAVTRQMTANLDSVIIDDDTFWACSDADIKTDIVMEEFAPLSVAQSTKSLVDASAGSSEDEDLDSDVADSGCDGDDNESYDALSALSPPVSGEDRSRSQSQGSLQASLNGVETAQVQAQSLGPTPRHTLSKIQWHQFMGMAEEDIARELTRIDWIMFGSIKPRDFVRHISSSMDQRKQYKGLGNVSRWINHFNHTAYWVANMILLREKPKHRAKALEKFMAIAWKLRSLNNYNSLGAILAGINGTAVHRLMQTRELVQGKTHKDFMRLEILMGTQRSHFAYRLAWDNTSGARIPFLPLHRRDLVSAEEGNRTFTGEHGDLINWKKFKIMGEVIVGIQKSQWTPYPVMHRNEDVQRLILHGKVCLDDDELYNRSVQLEGHRLGESMRKKFNWFQR